MTARLGAAFLALAVSALAAAAENAPVGKEKGIPQTQPDSSRVAVAVLDYEGTLPGNKELGTQIADILTARLSIEESFDLVERAKLGQILTEHRLKLAGLVDQEDAARVGKLVGARLLVMGKLFPVGKKLMIVTKVVGVETGKLKGTVRQADMKQPLSDIIMQLSEDVAGVIQKHARGLLPKDASLADPLVEIRKTLAGKAPAKVAVVIPEEHRARRVEPIVVLVLDPAVETEIKKTLINAGLTVMDTGQNDLADWARKMIENNKQPWPPALNEADYVIVGEAFSEFAGRLGDLVTCAARAEINVIDRKTGQIVLADRHTDRAVDLAEALAGKTALQKAGRRLGLRVVTHFAKTLPAAEAKKTTKEKGDKSNAATPKGN